MLKIENEELKKKLHLSKKKVNELKNKLSDNEAEIRRYQELEKKWIEGHNSSNTDRENSRRKKSNRSAE